MLKRIFSSLIFPLVVLFAAPNLQQIQQAVAQNPALLNTPEAKAVIAQQKTSLKADKSIQTDGNKSSIVTNVIDIDAIDINPK